MNTDNNREKPEEPTMFTVQRIIERLIEQAVRERLALKGQPEKVEGTSDWKKLYELQKEYTEWLDENYKGCWSIADVHGFKFSVEQVAKGEEYRKKLSELKAVIDDPKNTSDILNAKVEVEPTCGQCGEELTLVRPGKHQCDNPECVQNKVEGITAEEIEAELEKLPYTKHLDDGRFNDGQIVGMEKGIWWAIERMKKIKF